MILIRSKIVSLYIIDLYTLLFVSIIDIIFPSLIALLLVALFIIIRFLGSFFNFFGNRIGLDSIVSIGVATVFGVGLIVLAF